MQSEPGNYASKTEWLEELSELNHLRKQSAWALADTALAGLQSFGDSRELYDEMSEQLELARHTIQNYVSAARRFPPDRRVESLEIGHHITVLGLEPDHQDYWLHLAFANGWSVSKLRGYIYVGKGERHPATTPVHVSNRFKEAGVRTTIHSSCARFEVDGVTVICTSDTPITWRMSDD